MRSPRAGTVLFYLAWGTVFAGIPAFALWDNGWIDWGWLWFGFPIVLGGSAVAGALLLACRRETFVFDRRAAEARRTVSFLFLPATTRIPFAEIDAVLVDDRASDDGDTEGNTVDRYAVGLRLRSGKWIICRRFQHDRLEDAERLAAQIRDFLQRSSGRAT